ncbi:MAG: MarR family transcriptional regulator [Candidatus Velthaea sp.]|jgi:DNA-binding MarR family transcriptional regulator
MNAMESRLESLLGYRLRRAQLSAFHTFAQAVGELGLTPMLYGVLVVLDERPGVSQTELAAALGADPSTMVRLLDQLEKREWVRRASSPKDRRSTLPALTLAGRTLLREATPLVVASDERIATRLTPAQRATLLELLGELQTPAGEDEA